jgi:hypothetical protein
MTRGKTHARLPTSTAGGITAFGSFDSEEAADTDISYWEPDK